MSRTLRFALGAALLLKILFAWVIPGFGDEAYYVYWGSHFSGGFYDLPPMIGWWLWPFLKLSHHPFWTRVPAMLAGVLIALGLRDWLKSESKGAAPSLAAALFFLLPLPFLSVFSFPDVPLMFFGFFSARLFDHGLRQEKRFFNPHLLSAGALFGAAFLSKYFAVLLLPAFLIYGIRNGKHRIQGAASFAIGALPFLLQHLHWNRDHCWSNFVFNLVTRQRVSEGPGEVTAAWYGLFLLVAGAPVLVSGLSLQKVRASGAGGLRRFLFLLWAVPVFSFGVSSLFGKGQGLHWLLFLTPFFAAWAGLALPPDRLKRAVRLSIGASLMLGLFGVLVFSFPRQSLFRFFEHRYRLEYEMTLAPRSFSRMVLADQASMGASAVFTSNYSFSSSLDWALRRFGDRGAPLPIGVWGGHSRFGRVFDWTASWKPLEGKTLLILRQGKPDAVSDAPYFEEVSILPRVFGGSEFHWELGRGFRAERYFRERVKPELDQFYLPFLPGTCSIQEWRDAR